jgi:cytochrome c biogenesis protein CcdA
MVVMFLAGAIFVLVICAFALIATFMLGVNQNKKQNESYDKNRRKTVLWLSVIYLVAIILGVYLVYTFIIER